MPKLASQRDASALTTTTARGPMSFACNDLPGLCNGCTCLNPTVTSALLPPWPRWSQRRSPATPQIHERLSWLGNAESLVKTRCKREAVFQGVLKQKPSAARVPRAASHSCSRPSSRILYPPLSCKAATMSCTYFAGSCGLHGCSRSPLGRHLQMEQLKASTS